jgi:hypothetical protein
MNTMQMEVACYSETLILTYQTIQRHNPDHNMNQLRKAK